MNIVLRIIFCTPAADVFRLNALPENTKKDLTVSASFFEIYSGKVYDLLNKKVRLRILEDAKQQVQVRQVLITCTVHVVQVHYKIKVRLFYTTCLWVAVTRCWQRNKTVIY